MREEYQAICLGAKVGRPRPTQEAAWHEVWEMGMILFPDKPNKRRAFEDLCQIARVVQVSFTAGSASEDHSMASPCIMVSPLTAYQPEPGRQ